MDKGKIAGKLISLGARPLFGGSYFPQTDIINRLEKTINCSLPKDYSECLQFLNRTTQFGADVVFKGISPSPWASNGFDSFELWFADSERSRDIFSVKEKYSDRIPDYLLVIGEAAGGNLICMNCSVAFGSEILFWDHEEPDPENCFYKVADDFSSFVDLLTMR